MKVNFEVHDSHIALWDEQDWRYAFLMGGRGNGRSGTASRYIVSRLLGAEYTRGAIMREVREDILGVALSDEEAYAFDLDKPIAVLRTPGLKNTLRA